MTYTWAEIAQAIADKVFGFSMYNNIRNNLLALKERFEVEHDWSDGKSYRNGVVAHGLLSFDTSSPTFLGTPFNMSSASRAATGRYTVTLTDTSAISAITPVSAIMEAGAAGNPYILVATGQSNGTVLIYVYNTSGTLVDPASGDFCSVAVWANP